MAGSQSSNLWRFALLSACIGGCAPDAELDRILTLKLQQFASCAPESITGVELQALGDFDATNRTFETEPEVGQRLEFPSDTQAVIARVSTSTQGFFGLGHRQEQHIDVLLWPELEGCTLSADEGQNRYPDIGGGQAAGFSADTNTLLIVGGDASESPAVVGALIVSTATGRVHLLDEGGPDALKEPRAHATVSAFNDMLLVAGGEDPLIGALAPELRTLRDSAELFDPRADRFLDQAISLLTPRSRHGAVELVDGSVLLVGGRGAANTALTALESVSPVTGLSTLTGFLEEGRIFPSVLRLDNGQVFVGGGVTAATKPARTFEYLSPDGSRRLRSLDPASGLEPRFDRAFADLPGGAVLAVGGCADRRPEHDEDSDACLGCTQGCRPASGWDFAWIPESSDPEVFSLDFPVPRPRLVSGTDGAPLLIVEDPRTGEVSVYRFNPWRIRFEPLDVELPAHAPGSPPPLSLGRGAFAFLANDLTLFGLRFDTRDSFDADLPLVSVSRADDSLWPAHLAPDRPPAAHGHGESRLVYDGLLTLKEGRVFITDTRYADFHLQVAVESATLPEVVVGGASYGYDGCAWPSSDAVDLIVERRGEVIELSRGDETHRCSAPPGRVQIGFGAPRSSAAILREIVVTRLQ